jgi:hypothetical protein
VGLSSNGVMHIDLREKREGKPQISPLRYPTRAPHDKTILLEGLRFALKLFEG